MAVSADTKEYLLSRLNDSYGFLGDAVTVTDRDNKVIYVNAAFEELYGYSREELLGQPVSLIVPPGELEIRPCLGKLGLVANMFILRSMFL